MELAWTHVDTEYRIRHLWSTQSECLEEMEQEMWTAGGRLVIEVAAQDRTAG